MSTRQEIPTLRALVVGIDKYESSLEGGAGPRYQDLAGCVQDALAMEAYLRQDLEIPAEQITCLLHENTRTPHTEAPTYERLLQALDDLLRESRPGDQVLVHFAGHGGRTPTLFPELKGQGGKDEGLVPADISDRGSQYVRDVELCFWLERMAERGVFVSLILDCCHAGGARRQGTTGLRTSPRSNEVEQRLRDRPSLMAPRAELLASWRRSNASLFPTRGRGSGWPMTPQDGHSLLAACSASQAALEYQLPDGTFRGAFTFWLLHILRRQGSRLTFRELHRRVKGQLQQLFWGDQTPQLEGDGERLLFEPTYCSSVPTLEILERRNNHALLGAGRVQGLRKGMQLEVFPPDWEGSGAADDCPPPSAVVETESVGAVKTTVRIVQEKHETPLTAGFQALAPSTLLHTTTLQLSLSLDETEHREIVAATERARDIAVVPPGVYADWELVCDQDSNLRFLNADGHSCPNQGPPIPRLRPGAFREAISRVQHLSRFSRIAELENFDPSSRLRDRLELTLHRLPDSFDIGDEPVPGTELSESCTLEEGSWICLTLVNRWEAPLHMAILDLQPLWSILQIFPYRSDGHLLEPNGEIRIPLCASLPRNLEAGRDLLKIFATLEGTHLSCLQMPVLGGSVRSSQISPTPSASLGNLLASMVDESLVRRDLTRQPDAGSDWTVQTVSLSIRARREFLEEFPKPEVKLSRVSRPSYDPKSYSACS